MSCNGKPAPDNVVIDNKFVHHISSFTTGIVSNNSEVRIVLSQVVAGVENGQKADDLFSFTPKIKGQAIWKNNRTIVFIPLNRLPSGVLYGAKFNLGKCIKVETSHEEFVFDFKVKTQDLTIDITSMEPYDESNLVFQRITGELSTADYADLESFKDVLKAEQNQIALNVKWIHNEDGLTHIFFVDSVLRKEERGTVLLEWNGEYIESETKGELEFEIPSLMDFEVINVNNENQPNQVIRVRVSDPINRNQDLQGILYLQSGEAVQYEVVKNEIRLYPKTNLVGNKVLIIDQSLANSNGHKLEQGFEIELMFSPIKPQIMLIGKGNIIPNSNKLLFPFKAVNLSSVDVTIIKVYAENIPQFLQVNQIDGNNQIARVGDVVHRGEVKLMSERNIIYDDWNNFSIDLSTYIQAEPGAIYRVELSAKHKYSLYTCDTDEDSFQKIVEIEQADDSRQEFDGPSYYNSGRRYHDGFKWSEQDNPCKASYYMRNNLRVVKNFLASDFGIIAKAGTSNKLVTFVTDIKTSKPLSRIKVEVYDYQNVLLGTATSDVDGRCAFDLDSKPFLLVAKKGQNRGYLRLDDGSALSVSMFDVGGNKLTDGIKGFIYTERGVWRPGDTVHTTFVLQNQIQEVPTNHPLIFEVYTPDNQLYIRTITHQHINGFYDLEFKTSHTDMTGNWMAKVKIGGAQFSKSIRIETVMPNRLKVEMAFDAEILSKSNNNAIELSSRWLHGAIASNLKADVSIKFAHKKTLFDDFTDYSFDDESKSFNSKEEQVFEGLLDSLGNATFHNNVSIGESAPGMLRATFKARVFENSGAFSINNTHINYSPFESYVGVKVPKGNGWNNSLLSDQTNLIAIATVDENGKPINRDNLLIEIFDVKWRWWWESDNQYSLATYVSNKSKYLIQSSEVNSKNGKAIFELKFEDRLWGRKFMKITDPISGHSCGQTFYVSYSGWQDEAEGDLPGSAEMVTFEMDQEKYVVGDQAKIILPKSNNGNVLISIENGSELIEQFWHNPTSGDDCTFIISEDMAPNAYVHISVIQEHGQNANDLPIRMYGINNIKVEDPNTFLKPVISMPDVLEPESDFEVTVSEEQGLAMTYTISVVDEGLLDLTRFKTPNPWTSFFSREALGVKTWDMYSYVLGAFTGEMAGLLALGGDESTNQNDGKNASRFKPVVVHLGPFTLKKGKSQKHKISMPNYVGSVRTMVVAGNNAEHQYGSSEKTTPVKKPLMVLATLPRQLSPGDNVMLPVTVFAMNDEIKEVKVRIEINDAFNTSGSLSKTIKFKEQGDQLIIFDLSCKEKLSIGKVKVICESAGYIAYDEIELDVKPSNSSFKYHESLTLEANSELDYHYSKVGINGTNNAIIELSRIPSINLNSRLDYLIQYPHGCIEQTTSSVFPQLYLGDLMELSNNEETDIQNNISAALDRLKKFQIKSGGFSYWPGNSSTASDWGTNYAGHFLVEAKQKGYSIPFGLLENWMKYQKKEANLWNIVNIDKNDYHLRRAKLNQAYRLFTLALSGNPAVGAMNRMLELEMSPTAKWLLAASYGIIGKDEVGRNLVYGLSTDVSAYFELGGTYGSQLRDEAIILTALGYLNKVDLGGEMSIKIATKLSSDKWYSTQSTAFALLGISSFLEENSQEGFIKATIEIDGNDYVIESENVIARMTINNPDQASKIIIKNDNNQRLYARIVKQGTPLNCSPLKVNSELNLTVKYYDMNDVEIDPTYIEQGTDFYAEVDVYNPGRLGYYDELALTMAFPAGWEIRNNRLAGDASDDRFDYQDIRDDRVLTYFGLGAIKGIKLKVILHASYVGDYCIPSVICEAMYSDKVQAIHPGKTTTVFAQD